MAKRPAWTIHNEKILSREFDFTWNGGFAASQKKKNIINLHNAIKQYEDGEILEVSTKSNSCIGNKLSAFNLKLNEYYLENVFQSSKKYENGGPYRDLLNVQPKLAKKDERHKNSGELIAFDFNDEKWNLEPKTAFYDYIYIKAAIETIPKDELVQIAKYDWFTDIEFNPKKSINCQARSVAILKYILINDKFVVTKNHDSWINFHNQIVNL